MIRCAAFNLLMQNVPSKRKRYPFTELGIFRPESAIRPVGPKNWGKVRSVVSVRDTNAEDGVFNMRDI